MTRESVYCDNCDEYIFRAGDLRLKGHRLMGRDFCGGCLDKAINGMNIFIKFGYPVPDAEGRILTVSKNE